MAYIRTTEEMRKEIRAMRRQGYSHKRICEKFKISQSTSVAICKGIRVKGCDKYPPELRMRISEMRFKEKMRYRDIAKMLNIPIDACYRYRFGV